MNGIDISAWQGDENIDLAKVSYDFCIVKATEGTDYKNRYFTAHCDKVLSRKKLLGAYHYANGGNPQKEADYFLAYAKKYIGKAILVLDWEAKTTIYLVSRIWSGACSGAVMCRKRQALSH